jgi:hypothetical protein
MSHTQTHEIDVLVLTVVAHQGPGVVHRKDSMSLSYCEKFSLAKSMSGKHLRRLGEKNRKNGGFLPK